MHNKTISIDFEYNDKRLVCCCTLDSEESQPRTWWLVNYEQTEDLKTYIESHREDRVFICHALEKAEGCSFWRLGLDPRKFRWYDTYTVEMIRVKANNVDLTKGEQDMYCGLSLVDLEYRYLFLPDRSKEKKYMRDLIISDNNLEENKQAVLDYCSEDIDGLRKIADHQIHAYSVLSKSGWVQVVKLVQGLKRMDGSSIDWEELFIRLCYAPASYSRCYFLGVPLDSRIKRLYDRQSDVLSGLQELFNENHYEIFTEDKKKKKNGTGKFKEDQKKLQELIKNSESNIRESEEPDFTWPCSDKGKYKTDEETMKDPRIKRLSWTKPYKEIKDIGKTFSRLKNIHGIEDGGELITHPTHKPFGTQTGRCAPPTKEGYVWGWSHIYRVQVNPRDKNHMLVAVDYSAEENAIIGGFSGDNNYKECYKAKDFYIKTGQLFGLIKDPNATKKSHPTERETVKIFMLMKGYGSGDRLIARHLNTDLKKAQELSKMFENTFTEFSKTKQALVDLLESPSKMATILLLPDDMPYVCWNIEDNYNFRPGEFRNVMRLWGLLRKKKNRFKKTTSLTNLPIQGGGSSILRRIIKKSDEADLDFIGTIHDEVVYNIPKETFERDVEKVKSIFTEAFQHFYGDNPIKVGEPEVREYDGKIISHEDGDNELWKKLIHLGMYTEDEIELA